MRDEIMDLSIRPFIEEKRRKNIRRVAALTRVSTKHEQQMNALDNQNEWIRSEIAKHEEWRFDEEKDLYVDSGVSGTSAKNRAEFNQMIARAKAGQYDLIITREVSRFMRNLQLTLVLVNELKECGVEIYFVNDGIWTFNDNDYFKLTIMGTYAEQESKKVSERVLSGQEISRKKGVLYGNGNILGYDLVKGRTSEENTYKINREEADTVKRIYELSLEGKGIKKIKRILTEEKRKNSVGEVKWYESSIERILRNRTYRGDIEYFKSYTENPITHKRKKINDISKRHIVEGRHEAIIDPQIWDKVQEGIDSRINRDLTNAHRGLMLNQDVYCRKMRCECGRRFRRDKGRKAGMATYRCYNIIENGSKAQRGKEGLSTEGSCSLPGIIDWKLDFYTMKVFQFLSLETGTVKGAIMDALDECYVDKKEGIVPKAEIKNLENAIQKLEKRIGNLVDMRADGEISKDDFIDRRMSAEQEIIEKRKQLAKAQCIKENYDAKKECLKEAEKFLDEALHFDQLCISKELVEIYVNSIKVYNDNTFEYNIRLNPKSDSDRPEKDNENYRICDGKSVHKIDNSNAATLHEFCIGYDEAKAYANSLGRKVNRLHWQDVKIRILANL